MELNDLETGEPTSQVETVSPEQHIKKETRLVLFGCCLLQLPIWGTLAGQYSSNFEDPDYILTRVRNDLWYLPGAFQP